HPIFNSSLDETTEEIVFKKYYNLGVAVDTEQGLIVPVLKDFDKKDMTELSKSLSDLAEKTRQRKISLEELQGSTFTISNQGGIGGAHFTPIVNKPDVAILGLGQGKKKPAVKNDKVEVRMMLPLALSYDHRVVDGANAARFITDLVGAIENFDEKKLKKK
ncbi:MAG: 2-oxo acid dehydrogenase subunit E2, partial [Candidatus Omnitrophica bacterium]|nr:2-oxo acid dehydrogenase subunit E2 [Candidatus Omnitrophota bacterium]